jgi:alpha-tubulin suppressor-like RCC1 family protein
LYEPTLIHINKSLKINSQNNINNHIGINENDDEFIIKISCGEAHSLALSSKGEVYSWGFGSNGQLGLGFCEDSFEPGLAAQKSRKFTPQYLKSLEDVNIKDIQCGKTFTMFINDRKEVLACGVNDLSQLGIKEYADMRKNNDNTCYDVVWPTILDYLIDKKVQKLSCGEAHCLAIVNYPENVKSIWSWGNNKFGQLGHGSWLNKSLPKPINFLLGFNNEKVQFEEISCGGFHSLCLIKYKEDLSWIEDDFKAIVDTINSNENFITSNLNSPEDLKSENIPHINKFKFNF